VLIPAGVPHATIATGGELRLVCFFPHPDLARNTEELDGIIRL
jgi:quercetin dioxygenase-like cupin family protein